MNIGIEFEFILVFFAVLCGVISAAYFYQSAGIFMDLLKRPLRFISSGVMLMTLGVLLSAFISYEAERGVEIYLYNLPLAAFFYLLYIVGSILILIGARRFTYRPKQQI